MNKPRTPPVKFLLVDDHEENLLALEALLEREGLEILKARSGNAALELLLLHDLALALLDVHMPEMDGFALAELMRGSARARHVPIIFVTANPLEQHRLFQGYDAGAVDFLIKPIDPLVLRHKTESPLNAIVVGADLILRTTTEPLTRRAAERVHSSGRRMSRMVDELFDLARVRLGGGLPIERQQVDPRALVERVVAEQQATSPHRKILLTAEGAAEVQWDGGRIEQVLANLIGNAVRHGAPEQPVAVTLRSDDDSVWMTVHNRGAIAPDLLPQIFAPFVSRQGIQSSEGLGLGLYIVHQIVLAHGGDIDVRSTSDEGTTFSVRLPRH